MVTTENRLANFPSLDGRTYLNTAAEGIPPLRAGEALQEYFEDKTLGMDGREAHFARFEETRNVAGRLFELPPESISFCSSTSEAYNLLATALPCSPGENIVISDLDFPSGATPWLRHPGSPEVRLWKQHDGVLHPEELETLVDDRTRLVQLSLVSFLTGYRLDWPVVRDIVRRNHPETILSIDVTQAAGRVVLDCLDADCLFASSYKWLLGVHGAGVVAVPPRAHDRITTRAGGWYHLVNGFDEDRFERAESLPGAPGFTVGMPSFPALYALREGMSFLAETGIPEIARHTDPLIQQLHEGLSEIGIPPMSPPQPGNSSGIVSFRHPDAEALNHFLRDRGIHIMHHAGRLRVSVHGYNTAADIEHLLTALAEF